MSTEPNLKPSIAALADLSKRMPQDSSNFLDTNISAFRDEARKIEGMMRAVDSEASYKNPIHSLGHWQNEINKKLSLTKAEVDRATLRLAKEFSTGMEAINRSIDRKLNLVPGKYEMQVLNHFLSLKEGDKHQFLKTLADRRDSGPEISAILNAPLYLSGLTEETRNLYRDRMTQNFAPEIMAERNALENAMEVSNIVFRVAIQAHKDFTNFDLQANVAAIEKNQRAASVAFENAQKGMSSPKPGVGYDSADGFIDGIPAAQWHALKASFENAKAK